MLWNDGGDSISWLAGLCSLHSPVGSDFRLEELHALVAHVALLADSGPSGFRNEEEADASMHLFAPQHEVRPLIRTAHLQLNACSKAQVNSRGFTMECDIAQWDGCSNKATADMTF